MSESLKDYHPFSTRDVIILKAVYISKNVLALKILFSIVMWYVIIIVPWVSRQKGIDSWMNSKLLSKHNIQDSLEKSAW